MTDTTLASAGLTGAKLIEELGGVKAAVRELIRRARRSDALPAKNLPEPLADAYLELVQHHVAEDIAEQLVEKVRAELGEERASDPSAVYGCLSRFVESMLPLGGPIRLSRTSAPTVIALVGPTGVGKTTTIAKLAANFSLREGKKVGLITIDTFRIAAVEQLRTYAQIINVPLEVVMTSDRMRQAVNAMRDRDVVLVDTVGRSQNDRIRLNELKCFLDAAEVREVHLVLSSTCSQGVLLDTVERYRDLNVSRVIFTKLDEAIGFGTILTCLTRAQARLSYVTTGQNVPDDVEVARGCRLAGLIVHGTRLTPD